MPEETTPMNETATETQTPDDLEKLKKAAAERDHYLDLAQRAKAEFENYQKRVSREREQERKYAYGPMAYDLLPVLDNLDRALSAAEQAKEQGSLVQGVGMVQTQFLELLKRYGIVPIVAQGKPFDPNQHQAVMEQPSAEAEPGTVLHVLEKGFMNQDRVLRAAKVIVSTKP